MQRPPVQRRNAPQPARRRPPQKPQKKRNTLKDWLSNPLIAILLVVVIVAGYVVIRRARTIDNDYYLSGVYINGVDMSAYKKEQGENMLNQWADSILHAEYLLTYGDKSWTITPRDFDAVINTEDVLEKAWFFGHTGSAADRENMMMSLKYSPQELWTSFKKME